MIALLAFQVFLNIAAYNAALTGMKNVSLFVIGVILLVFAAFFHVYRYSMSEAQNAPPPPAPVFEEKPKLMDPELPSEQPKLTEEGTASDAKPQEKELAAEINSPKTQADVGSTKADSGSGNDSKS